MRQKKSFIIVIVIVFVIAKCMAYTIWVSVLLVQTWYKYRNGIIWPWFTRLSQLLIVVIVDPDPANWTSADELREVNTAVHTLEECRQIWEDHTGNEENNILDQHICIGLPDLGACHVSHSLSSEGITSSVVSLLYEWPNNCDGCLINLTFWSLVHVIYIPLCPKTLLDPTF